MDKSLESTRKELTWDDIKNDRIINAKRNKLFEEIMCLFNNGDLKLVPSWHTDKEEINLDLQSNKIDKEYLVEGFSVIEGVEVERLLDTMMEGNPELYREKQLFHEELDWLKISDIIDYWLRQIKLIPPTLSYVQKLDQTYLTDGKHRFNVAYYFNQTHIPLIVPNIYLADIRRLLNLM